MDRILHGGDYNPEQWQKYPGVVDEDFRLFRQARINSVSVGIFSWAELEPQEGKFEFGWLDDIFERALRENISVILSTPSSGLPHWISRQYPDALRVGENGRTEYGGRHNHCYTSPVYREKVWNIDAKLSERYGKHPALVLWHISNEFAGECHCEKCMDAFRLWLKERYGDIESLNEAYWARFWSHTYRTWDDVECLDPSVKGLMLDWKRFCTRQCRDFLRNEKGAIRRYSPNVPVTTNMMPNSICMRDYNLFELCEDLDVVSWDSYPRWHSVSPSLDETGMGAENAFMHDFYRSAKKQPFLMMETTPSQVNWGGVSPLRRPGIHRLHSLQAISHGADSVCYFQLRMSRGSTEQFHGAVIDHSGSENTRVFREVSEVGATLEKLGDIVGGSVKPKVALFYDFENYWAIQNSSSPQNDHKNYSETVISHYKPFWSQGIAVDIVNSNSDLEDYDLVVAPMLTLLQDNQGEKIAQFVEQGGTFVATYQTGIVDKSTLAFRGGFPGPLRKLLGIWVEEFDALPDSMRRQVVPHDKNTYGLSGVYEARHYLDLLHTEGAEVIATYGDDFYAGRPAVTLNRYGKGEAYYIASRNDERFLSDFTIFLANTLALPKALKTELPYGVTAHQRVSKNNTYIFIFNFTAESRNVELDERNFVDAETGEVVDKSLVMPPFGSRVFKVS